MHLSRSLGIILTTVLLVTGVAAAQAPAQGGRGQAPAGRDASPPPMKNRGAGGAWFEPNCSNCHRVGGRGGRVGPDLSRVGSSRSSALLEHKIRHASAYIMSIYQGGVVLDGYQPVTLVTKDGQRIRGVKKN